MSSCCPISRSILHNRSYQIPSYFALITLDYIQTRTLKSCLQLHSVQYLFTWSPDCLLSSHPVIIFINSIATSAARSERTTATLRTPSPPPQQTQSHRVPSKQAETSAAMSPEWFLIAFRPPDDRHAEHGTQIKNSKENPRAFQHGNCNRVYADDSRQGAHVYKIAPCPAFTWARAHDFTLFV